MIVIVKIQWTDKNKMLRNYNQIISLKKIFSEVMIIIIIIIIIIRIRIRIRIRIIRIIVIIIITILYFKI